MTAIRFFADAIPGDSFGTNPQLSTGEKRLCKLSLFARLYGSGLRTGVKGSQVIDKKRENVIIHRGWQALSTTTNLNQRN
jgi:hypothetical protein